jgi:hypothetical protein
MQNLFSNNIVTRHNAFTDLIASADMLLIVIGVVIAACLHATYISAGK